ncbi:MAG: phosphoribosyl-AMP cyclohydrolase [Crocinitomicaceae bacterium]|jgi:phosphoribosyl-AMP cyclohydrolase|uniref:Histidine biosynthesis bifunctional protein HisIE n=1 Tax=Rubritalea profundi TaxID=1658618 RepID=A0A2S7TYK5_9BACT|nr:phosphoribosyl-AMP cyclohydrolase [Rubritalea profundi]PQJ27826.1 phosphoribosyl-AMP cyclohydrolase [Rubritalea profundi]
MSNDIESTIASIPFAERESVHQVEEAKDLAPKFDEKGCIPCITMHAESKEVLMFAFMNEEALRLTISTRLAHYWSRSRQQLWKKGETSGMFQHVQRILIDDDQDCVIIEVALTPPSIGGKEASCHVGYRSCFYREIPLDTKPGEAVELKFTEGEKSFDEKEVYKGTANPTQL